MQGRFWAALNAGVDRLRAVWLPWLFSWVVLYLAAALWVGCFAIVAFGTEPLDPAVFYKSFFHSPWHALGLFAVIVIDVLIAVWFLNDTRMRDALTSRHRFGMTLLCLLVLLSLPAVVSTMHVDGYYPFVLAAAFVAACVPRAFTYAPLRIAEPFPNSFNR